MKQLIFTCLLLTAGALRAQPVDVLLAAATDAELQPLIRQLANPRQETRATWTCWTGTLFGKAVALVRTEGDPLNAVAATTLAIRRHHPRLVLTYGTARPLDPALAPGELVASSSFAAFDGLVSAVTPLGGGVHPLQWERLPHLMMTAGEQETAAFTYPAAAPVLAVAEQLPAFRGHLVAGVLGSANQVNQEADRIAWLHREWGAVCADGESAHIAGCAGLLGVPVIGLRLITSPTASTAATATAEAASADAALKLLEALP